MRRGLKFMVHRKLAPALRSWLAALAPSDKQDSMTKALRHLLHRGLSRGWVGWHAHWREAVRERERARQRAKLLKVRVRVRVTVTVTVTVRVRVMARARVTRSGVALRVGVRVRV